MKKNAFSFLKNAFYRLFNQFLDQIFPLESTVSPDSLMKSLRILQISGEKLETPMILAVFSFSLDFCGLLRDFIKLSGLTADSGGKS